MQLTALALALFCAVASAFVPAQSGRMSSKLLMTAENRRDMAAKIISAVAVPLIGASVANAKIDYEGVPYLGGSDKIDVNNANIRVYTKLPGFYPTIASKVVSNGPYKSVSEIYNIKGLSDAEKAIIKKYESRLLALDPQPEYVIDKINNGLYK